MHFQKLAPVSVSEQLSVECRAEKIVEDTSANGPAWKVIEAIFTHPDFKVAGENKGWLHGKTMVFVKTSSTLQEVDKMKDLMMQEVLIKERARINMIAASIKDLRNAPLQRQVDAVDTMRKYVFKMDSAADGVAFFTYKKWSEVNCHCQQSLLSFCSAVLCCSHH